jgi:hypothetical protein
MAARRLLSVLTALAVVVACGVAPLRAADQWIEIKSAHFRSISNASDGRTRTLLWQFEQIRSAVAAMWPWARPDLNKPLTIFILKDEAAMRAMAPQYWEDHSGIRPASLWATGADNHYIAIREDVRSEDKDTLNPYQSAYFAYVSMVLDASSIGADLPRWYSRGLAGLLSNTIVRDTYLSIGAPIPWHIQRIRRGPRYSITELVRMDARSPAMQTLEGMLMFDAQAWALIHFLVFHEDGKRRGQPDQFSNLLRAGKDPQAAFLEAIGRPADLEQPLNFYVNQKLFTYDKRSADVNVKREGFTSRPLEPAEAASARALFHVAMRRPD